MPMHVTAGAMDCLPLRPACCATHGIFRPGGSPSPEAIAELLPRIGLDKVPWDKPRSTFETPGMQLDLGGIGKEYAADPAAEICAAIGLEHGLVDFGGDIRLIGPRPGGLPWKIGIRHPRIPDRPIAAVDLVAARSQPAATTSGSSRSRGVAIAISSIPAPAGRRGDYGRSA